MSLWEWGAILCIALLVDGAQLVLDYVLVIGFAFNWLIDISFGMALSFYWWWRGVKPTVSKGLLQAGMTGIEALGDGSLPFWWLDVVMMFFLVKSDSVIAKYLGKMKL